MYGGSAERERGRERGLMGVVLSTGDNRSLRARLVQLLLFLSGCAGGCMGAGDPLYLEDMQRGTKSISC